MYEVFEFYQPIHASEPTVEIELLSCDLDDAPERSESGGEFSTLRIFIPGSLTPRARHKRNGTDPH